MSSAGAESLFADLGAVRAGATEFTTNFYATPADAQGWMDRGWLEVLASPEARLLLRADRDFSHLYHWAASPESLRRALADHLPALAGRTLVADVIGTETSLVPIERAYADAGFAPYKVLARMTRTSAEPIAEAAVHPSVRQPTPADIGRVEAFFQRLLDPYQDQVPTAEELERLVETGGILMVDRGPAVAGVLIFDRKAAAATLRYWYIAPESRNQGIGAALIRAMFHEVRDARRIQLWVVADNHDAIAKYEHYGFRRDGLLDRILIKRETDR